MATAEAALGAPPARSRRYAATALLALGAAAIALRLIDPARVPQLQNFLLIFGSLLIEAFPFILLGALVSAAIEVFVPASFFARVARMPGPLQMPIAGLGGFAFPVCECGSVPVARRLVAKGLSPAAAVTFMLAAPILNPVVLISTAIAYRGRDILWPMVLGRAGLGLLAALAAGWVFARRSKEQLLREPAEESTAHAHGASSGERWRSFFGHLAADTVFLGRFLVIGAAVAAALQTFIPQSVMSSVADTPIVSVIAFMVFAAMLSLCSESDAFVAASFVQFGAASQLAFLVFGPMVDSKLAFLYRGSFRRGFLSTIVVVVGAVTLVGALYFEVLVG